MRPVAAAAAPVATAAVVAEEVPAVAEEPVVLAAASGAAPPVAVEGPQLSEEQTKYAAVASAAIFNHLWELRSRGIAGVNQSNNDNNNDSNKGSNEGSNEDSNNDNNDRPPLGESLGPSAEPSAEPSTAPSTALSTAPSTASSTAPSTASSTAHVVSQNVQDDSMHDEGEEKGAESVVSPSVSSVAKIKQNLDHINQELEVLYNNIKKIQDSRTTSHTITYTDLKTKYDVLNRKFEHNLADYRLLNNHNEDIDRLIEQIQLILFECNKAIDSTKANPNPVVRQQPPHAQEPVIQADTAALSVASPIAPSAIAAIQQEVPQLETDAAARQQKDDKFASNINALLSQANKRNSKRLQEKRLYAAEARRIQEENDAAERAAAEAKRIQEEKEAAERAAAEAKHQQEAEEATRRQQEAAEAKRQQEADVHLAVHNTIEEATRLETEATRLETEANSLETEANSLTAEEKTKLATNATTLKEEVSSCFTNVSTLKANASNLIKEQINLTEIGNTLNKINNSLKTEATRLEKAKKDLKKIRISLNDLSLNITLQNMNRLAAKYKNNSTADAAAPPAPSALAAHTVAATTAAAASPAAAVTNPVPVTNPDPAPAAAAAVHSQKLMKCIEIRNAIQQYIREIIRIIETSKQMTHTARVYLRSLFNAVLLSLDSIRISNDDKDNNCGMTNPSNYTIFMEILLKRIPELKEFYPNIYNSIQQSVDNLEELLVELFNSSALYFKEYVLRYFNLYKFFMTTNITNSKINTTIKNTFRFLYRILYKIGSSLQNSNITITMDSYEQDGCITIFGENKTTFNNNDILRIFDTIYTIIKDAATQKEKARLAAEEIAKADIQLQLTQLRANYKEYTTKYTQLTHKYNILTHDPLFKSISSHFPAAYDTRLKTSNGYKALIDKAFDDFNSPTHQMLPTTQSIDEKISTLGTLIKNYITEYNGINGIITQIEDNMNEIKVQIQKASELAKIHKTEQKIHEQAVSNVKYGQDWLKRQPALQMAAQSKTVPLPLPTNELARSEAENKRVLALDDEEYNKIINLALNKHKIKPEFHQMTVNKLLNEIALKKNINLVPLSDEDYADFISRISAASENKNIQKQIVDEFITKVMTPIEKSSPISPTSSSSNVMKRSQSPASLARPASATAAAPGDAAPGAAAAAATAAPHDPKQDKIRDLSTKLKSLENQQKNTTNHPTHEKYKKRQLQINALKKELANLNPPTKENQEKAAKAKAEANAAKKAEEQKRKYRQDIQGKITEANGLKKRIKRPININKGISNRITKLKEFISEFQPNIRYMSHENAEKIITELQAKLNNINKIKGGKHHTIRRTIKRRYNRTHKK